MRRKLAFTAAILIALAAGFSRSDPDIWWHLASGRWIVTNGAIPSVDPFTSHPVPWVDYSWLFDVGVYGLYRLGGYGALLSGCVALFIAIVLALHALLKELKSSSWFGDALMLVALAGLTVLMTPRPWAFSILFSALEIIILLRHRDGASVRPLYLLPPLLALWSNLHIQFVLGLLWLAGAAVAAVLESPVGRRFSEKPRALLLCLAAAAACTFLNPYGYRVYEPVWFFLTAFGDFNGIQDSLPTWMLSQRFTWAVPAMLALVVFERVRGGRGRRLRAFSTLFFLAGLVLGLRMIRDLWILLLSAIVFACDGRREADAEVAPAPGVAFRTALAAAALGLNLAFGHFVYGLPLDAALSLRFPVWAADYVSHNVPPGPLFNDFSWGGYLAWALPEHPVLLDGRAPVCGPELFAETAATWNAREGWRQNKALLGARAIIANTAAPLTGLLRGDERFKVTYEDAVAVVFEPVATFH